MVDSQGNKKILKITTKKTFSFKGNFVNSPGWNYSVARIVFSKNIRIEACSTVKVFGEHSLSIESLEGDIVIGSFIDLSCTVTVLGGKCVGGYMPIDKPRNWSSAIIPGRLIKSVDLHTSQHFPFSCGKPKPNYGLWVLENQSNLHMISKQG